MNSLLFYERAIGIIKKYQCAVMRDCKKLTLIGAIGLCSCLQLFAQRDAVFVHPDRGVNAVFVDHLDYSAAKTMAFDSKNRPYIYKSGKINTLRNGIWTEYSIHNTFSSHFGDRFSRILGLFKEVYSSVVIDNNDNLYLIVQAYVDGVRKNYLVFGQNVASDTFNGTFSVKEGFIPDGIGFLESRNSNNNLDVPPSIVSMTHATPIDYPNVGRPGAHSDGSSYLWQLSLTTLSLDSNNELRKDTTLRISERAAYLTRHSGGHSLSVTSGNYVYVVYNRHDVDPAADANGDNVHYIRRYDRVNGVLSDSIKVCDATPDYADGHPTPTIGVDSSNNLHILSGSHGQYMTYVKIPNFNNTSTWVKNQIGSGRTYSELLIDGNNNMFSAFRGPMGLFFHKSTTQNGYSGPSNGERIVYQTNCGGYNGFYHTLKKDRTNRVFLSWTVLCGATAAINDGSRVIAFTDDQGTSWQVPTRYDFLENIINGKQVQRITTNTKKEYISSVVESTITLSATSNAGLPVSVELISGPARLSGNQLTFTGAAGDVKLRFYNNGNTQYYGDEVIETVKVGTSKGFQYGYANFSDIAAGDVDNDGIDELVGVRAYGSYGQSNWDATQNRIVIFRNNQTIKNFVIAGNAKCHALGVGNMDASANDEIVVLSENSNGVRKRILVLSSEGRVLQDWEAGGVHFHDLAVGDFDSDGVDEIAVIREKGGSPWDYTVNTIFIYEANGAFMTSWSVGTHDITEIAAGNFDNEGRDEIVVVSRSNVKITSRSGGRILYDWSYGGVWFKHVTCGDYDNDGKDEITLISKKGGSPFDHTFSKIITFEGDGQKTDEWINGDRSFVSLTAGNFDGLAGEEIALLRPNGNIDHNFVYSQAQYRILPTARSAKFDIAESEVIIYPIPVKDKLYVKGKLKSDSFTTIANASGAVISKIEVTNQNNNSFDLSFLKSGVYIFIATDSSGKLVRKTFVKR